MTITTEDISPTRKAVTITVPSDTVAGYESTLLKDFVSNVRIPGFRPGKVPVPLIKRQYAKEIAEGLREKTVTEAIKYLGSESKLDIYAIVSVKGDDALSATADAVLRLEVDIFPEFELPEYKGLDLPIEAASVSDEEVDGFIEKLRSRQARYEVVDRAAEKGDFVKLSYDGSIDGVSVKTIAPDAHLYGTQSATWEEAGAEDVPGIPEIVSGIVGKKAGDKAEFTHEFPEDFEVEALKGKKAVYAVEVFEVRAKILPDLDEAFFKNAKVSDLEELRTRTRKGLLDVRESELRSGQRQNAINILSAKVDIALPETALEHEAYNIFGEFAQLQARQGADVSEIESQREELLKGAREAAGTRVKAQVVLERIAKKEDLKVTNHDLGTRIAQEAYQNGENPEKYAREFAKDRERVREASRLVLFNKALDLVIENAKK
ncbi:MAG: trigger factor [Puniceicoccales bacterium]|nr:trigger factor [Puniceicoccales bacterium]